MPVGVLQRQGADGKWEKVTIRVENGDSAVTLAPEGGQPELLEVKRIKVLGKLSLGDAGQVGEFAFSLQPRGAETATVLAASSESERRRFVHAVHTAAGRHPRPSRHGRPRTRKSSSGGHRRRGSDESDVSFASAASAAAGSASSRRSHRRHHHHHRGRHLDGAGGQRQRAQTGRSGAAAGAAAAAAAGAGRQRSSTGLPAQAPPPGPGGAAGGGGRGTEVMGSLSVLHAAVSGGPSAGAPQAQAPDLLVAREAQQEASWWPSCSEEQALGLVQEHTAGYILFPSNKNAKSLSIATSDGKITITKMGTQWFFLDSPSEDKNGYTSLNELLNDSNDLRRRRPYSEKGGLAPGDDDDDDDDSSSASEVIYASLSQFAAAKD